MNIRKHFKAIQLPVSDIGIEQFSETFCHTGVCNNISSNALCPLLPDCRDIFTAQIENEGKATSLKHKVTKFKQKRKGKRERRYVCQAYPTFFSSNNEKFKATVEKILHGDNIIKQNNDKESAGKA
ncbi:MAG: hypothetical protein E3J47_05820 [Candidatus Stahlbacteria bacterium]|nr:MAG: hypothetical protein E3J47_05820 [Candidatus Stahlbacteria bacterium]